MLALDSAFLHASFRRRPMRGLGRWPTTRPPIEDRFSIIDEESFCVANRAEEVLVAQNKKELEPCLKVHAP